MGKSFALITLILGLLSHALSAGAAAAPKVVLAHGALNARIAPLWIAHEQKFFAKYGVESTVLLVRQIQIMVSGLGTGEIEFPREEGTYGELTCQGRACAGAQTRGNHQFDQRRTGNRVQFHDILTGVTMRPGPDIKIGR